LTRSNSAIFAPTPSIFRRIKPCLLGDQLTSITDFIELLELCQGENFRLTLFDDKVIVFFVDFEKRRSLLLLNVE